MLVCTPGLVSQRWLAPAIARWSAGCFFSPAGGGVLSVDRKALNIVVVGSSPTVGALSERVGPRFCQGACRLGSLHLLACSVALVPSVAWSCLAC